VEATEGKENRKATKTMAHKEKADIYEKTSLHVRNSSSTLYAETESIASTSEQK
jgi:hypothetical protein